MIVFKYFFKVLKKYAGIMIMFTSILVIFSVFSLKTNSTGNNFEATKPDVCIVNQDKDTAITKGLCEYLEKNANIKEIKDTEEARSDALFYREVNYIIYIPNNYGEDFINGKSPILEVKSTGDYQASLAQMLVDTYLQTATKYLENGISKEELVAKVGEALEEAVRVEMTSTIDNDGLSKASFYYNFANYSILAVCIYVVGMIMSSFKEQNIRKRTMVSPIKNRNYNRSIFLGIIVLGIVLWLVYFGISIILLKDVMLSVHGFYFAVNSLLFTVCALSIAFLVGTIVSNKEAINGIANVISLGTSFLCGAFVPAEFLPDFVLKIAHIFPSYWYIQSNEYIKTIETFSVETLKQLFINMGVIVLFIIVFLFITNVYSKKKN